MGQLDRRCSGDHAGTSTLDVSGLSLDSSAIIISLMCTDLNTDVSAESEVSLARMSRYNRLSGMARGVSSSSFPCFIEWLHDLPLFYAKKIIQVCAF